jgi:CMP-N-acetylneuraminic acid synthetase
VELVLRGVAPAAVTVTRAEAHPYLVYWAAPTPDPTGSGHVALGLEPVVPTAPWREPSQTYPDALRFTGAVMAARVGYWRHHGHYIGPYTVGYYVPGERSVDIDTLADFQAAERAIEAAQNEPETIRAH